MQWPRLYDQIAIVIHCFFCKVFTENLIITPAFDFFYFFMESFVFEQKVLFRVDFLSVTLEHRVQCPRVGLGVKI